MPKDNEILDELYDLFRGFMRQYSNLNPAGEVIHGHDETELLIIPVRNNSCVQRNQLERIHRLDRFHLLVVHSQMNTSTCQKAITHVLYISIETCPEETL